MGLTLRDPPSGGPVAEPYDPDPEEIGRWLRETLGSLEEVVAGTVYDSKSLREDKIRLEQQRKTFKKEINRYETEYRTFIEKAATASDAERWRLAKRAEIADKRCTVKTRRYKRNGVQLAAVVTIEIIRELFKLVEDERHTVRQGPQSDLLPVETDDLIDNLLRPCSEYDIDTELILITLRQMWWHIRISKLTEDISLTLCDETVETIGEEVNSDRLTQNTVERIRRIDPDTVEGIRQIDSGMVKRAVTDDDFDPKVEEFDAELGQGESNANVPGGFRSEVYALLTETVALCSSKDLELGVEKFEVETESGEPLPESAEEPTQTETNP